MVYTVLDKFKADQNAKKQNIGAIKFYLPLCIWICKMPSMQRLFSVEEDYLSYRKFNGSKSEVVTRGTLVSSDAVIVLPYDQASDRVLLVEQFRTWPYVNGDPNPWLLEPNAGLIEVGAGDMGWNDKSELI